MKRIIFAILLITLMGCAQEVEETTEPITIGFIGPLSGGATFFGVPMKQAIEMSVEEINAEGGVNGRSIEVVFENGECEGKAATSATQKLINVDGVKLIIGGLCSGETLAAAPIAEENQVILFSPGSGSPDITQAGDFIFRNFPSDASSASKVAQYAYDVGDTKVALLRENTDYTSALSRVFTENFDGEIVLDEAFIQDTTDFRSQLTKIEGKNPDGVYIATSSETSMVAILQQIGELGVDLQIYTNEFASSEIVLGEYAEQIEGAVFAEPKFDEALPKTAAMLAAFRERYGEITFIPFYIATAYDVPKIFADALSVCGEDTPCIRDFLYEIENRQGTAGMLTIDENGDPAFEYVIKKIENAQSVVLS